MKVDEYEMTPQRLEQIDEKLQETLGLEIEHEPYLADRFKELMMETETEA